MIKEKSTVPVREMAPSDSSAVVRRIFLGFLFLMIIFILFILLILDEYGERLLVAGGGVIGVVGLLLLQKRAIDVVQQALLRAQISEARHQSLLENIPVITYINDLSLESRTTYVSPQIEKILGYSQSEFLNNSSLWVEINFPEDRERVLAENIRTSQTNENFNMEYRLTAKSGNIVWMKDEASYVSRMGGTSRADNRAG